MSGLAVGLAAPRGAVRASASMVCGRPRAACVTWSCPLPCPQVITNLVKMLKSRDTRRSFCPPNHWLSEQEDIKADKVLLEDLLHIFH